MSKDKQADNDFDYVKIWNEAQPDPTAPQLLTVPPALFAFAEAVRRKAVLGTLAQMQDGEVDAS